jgi:hypothetical protein
MTNENRRAAAARIRALLAKTVENGCTEEEAMAAAAKAGELMDRYGIESSEVEIRAEKCQPGAYRSRAGKKGQKERSSGVSEVKSVASAIARFCSCRVYRNEAELRYFGLPSDVEIAIYMTDAIETAMRTSFRRWRKGPERPREVGGHTLRAGFMSAMATRLSNRLDEMRVARDGARHETSDGKSLVLVKDAHVTSQYEDYKRAMGLNLRPAKSKSVLSDQRAFEAGRAAADAHVFAAGVTSRSALRIGGGR